MHFIVFSFALYFLPAIVAAARRTHNATGILLLNVFLGWTVIGWFVALIKRDSHRCLIIDPGGHLQEGVYF